MLCVVNLSFLKVSALSAKYSLTVKLVALLIKNGREGLFSLFTIVKESMVLYFITIASPDF